MLPNQFWEQLCGVHCVCNLVSKTGSDLKKNSSLVFLDNLPVMNWYCWFCFWEQITRIFKHIQRLHSAFFHLTLTTSKIIYGLPTFSQFILSRFSYNICKMMQRVKSMKFSFELWGVKLDLQNNNRIPWFSWILGQHHSMYSWSICLKERGFS